MKPISTRPIFRLSFFTTLNYKITKKSHCLAFSTQTHQNLGSGYHPRRHDEESRRVRVSVWWDFENCGLPWNTNVFGVAQSITNALRANGIKGPIQITAFGDVMQMSRTNQEALSSSGIVLTHVPSGGKNSADRSLLVDLMCWVSNNPPPAHLFLISGDRDFAGILHRLRMNNYNILLAGPDNAPTVLCSAATIMWQWSSLLKGENLTGRLFNYPPDGPNNSWYGHYNAPLEDPFAVKEQSLCLPAEEPCRQIPNEVMKHIRQILNSYPDGIPISLLRTELDRSNLPIEKDLYGYKKFSRFLLAMPHIVKLDFGVEDKIFARGVNSKFVDESVPVAKSESSGSDEEFEVVTEKSTVSAPRWKAQLTNLQEFQNEVKKSESTSSTSMQGMKLKAQETKLQDLKKEEKQKESLAKRNMQEAQEQDRNVNLQEQQKKVEVGSPIVEIKEFSGKNGNPDIPSHSSEVGMLKRIWSKFFGNGDTNSSDKSGKKNDEILGGKNRNEERTPMTQFAESARPASFSPSSDEAMSGGKTAKSDDAVTDVSSRSTGFFNQFMSWFKSHTSSEVDDKAKKNAEKLDQVNASPKQLDIFSKESFWKEVETFVDTPDAAAAFLQSKTREQLVQNLQKHGPSVLKSLPEGDLLHLVDLLIKDKKWVDECDSQTFPFKLTRPAVGEDPLNNSSLSSNGLSHIFARRRANLQDPAEQNHQNPPHTGVPQPVSRRGSSSKPKSEILADCQKVIDHIVREYPEGFNMGRFRRLFLEKHGYALDLQKLGYEKLVNLLQIMPGVRMDSNLILPAAALRNLDTQSSDLPIQEDKVHPVTEYSHSTTKDDDSDSLWEELGPVNKIDTVLTSRGPKGKTEYDYEPVDLDAFSDSEEETTPARSENEIKSKSNDDSSLLQILDSWYKEKGVDGKKNEVMSTTNATDSEEKNKSLITNPIRKQKPSKRYSFVSDPDNTEDKLVHGILGSLRKSSEKSTESRVSS